MPRDFAILKKINFSTLSETDRMSVGRTSYVFSVYENDLVFNPGRQLIVTEGTNKLIQGILKIILTPKGTALEDREYGADLESAIGGKLQQDSYANLREGVVAALDHYSVLNSDNENLDECIQSVEEVKAVRDDTDPRVILIYVSVITKSNKLVNIVVPQVE